MRLLLLSILVAGFGTAVVVAVNYMNKGAAAFSNGPWVYIGYFVVIALTVLIMTLLMQRFGGK